MEETTMLIEINKSLCGFPSEMVTALTGQGNPSAIDQSAVVQDARDRQPRVGTAIGCFISGFKRNFGRPS